MDVDRETGTIFVCTKPPRPEPSLVISFSERERFRRQATRADLELQLKEPELALKSNIVLPPSSILLAVDTAGCRASHLFLEGYHIRTGQCAHPRSAFLLCDPV